MCDLDQLQQMGPARKSDWGMNRRQFARYGALAGAGATLAACTTTPGAAGALVENEVAFDAPGGTMDGVFIHPAAAASPGVILWPDIAGLRPAKVAMGRRLAEAGYAVFVANPYYRSVAGQQFADFEDWRNSGGFQAVAPWMERNSPENVMATARAVVNWLDAQGSVDSNRGIGNQGYCMTGSWTFYTAAALPSRVKAAASFHGGGLTGEGERVPVNLFDDLADDAQALIAIAQNDDAQDPLAKSQLRQAADAAGLEAEIEVYQGDHGWTVLDSPVYAEAVAELAWGNLLELYSEAL